MEQMYRRRGEYAHSNRPKTGIFRNRKSFFQKTLICLILFCLCLVSRFASAGPLMVLYKNINHILKTNTDFASLPDKVEQFLKEHLTKQEKNRQVSSELSVSAHLTSPISASVSSPFGLRTLADGTEAFHYGIDLAAPAGEKIMCAAEGTVSEAGESDDYGRYLLISHADEIYTLYAHCEKTLPKAGDAVTAGQVIATVGATGNATGPHLHFELRSGETWLDPARFIDFEVGGKQ